MPSLVMTIARVAPPAAGKQRSTIHGTDGSYLGAFPETVGTFQPGQTYDIEYTDSPWNGKTLRNVVSAKPVAAPPAAQQQRQAAQPQQQWQQLESTLPPEFNRQTHPVDSRRMWVCATLVAFINSGKVELEERSLAKATSMLGRLHDWAFEGDGRSKTH